MPRRRRRRGLLVAQLVAPAQRLGRVCAVVRKASSRQQDSSKVSVDEDGRLQLPRRPVWCCNTTERSRDDASRESIRVLLAVMASSFVARRQHKKERTVCEIICREVSLHDPTAHGLQILQPTGIATLWRQRGHWLHGRCRGHELVLGFLRNSRRGSRGTSLEGGQDRAQGNCAELHRAGGDGRMESLLTYRQRPTKAPRPLRERQQAAGRWGHRTHCQSPSHTCTQSRVSARTHHQQGRDGRAGASQQALGRRRRGGGADSEGVQWRGPNNAD